MAFSKPFNGDSLTLPPQTAEYTVRAFANEKYSQVRQAVHLVRPLSC